MADNIHVFTINVNAVYSQDIILIWVSSSTKFWPKGVNVAVWCAADGKPELFGAKYLFVWEIKLDKIWALHDVNLVRNINTKVRGVLRGWNASKYARLSHYWLRWLGLPRAISFSYSTRDNRVQSLSIQVFFVTIAGASEALITQLTKRHCCHCC